MLHKDSGQGSVYVDYHLTRTVKCSLKSPSRHRFFFSYFALYCSAKTQRKVSSCVDLSRKTLFLLQHCRIVVRIDAWPIESFLPEVYFKIVSRLLFFLHEFITLTFLAAFLLSRASIPVYLFI